MINASKEFREKLREGANVVNYADLILSNGKMLHLEPKDFMVGGCKVEDKTTDGKFGVGFVIGKTLTLRIANHDERFSQYDFYNSVINLYVALLLDDGSIEKIRKGVYYTMVPETPGDIIEISAVDKMFRLDQDYSASTTKYPATLQTILSNACIDCGIPIGFRQFNNMSFIVQKKPENVSYRQVVSYVCQIAGYNARIDNDGYMQLIWYNTRLLELYNYDGGGFNIYSHDTVIDGGNFKDYSADTVISGGLFTDELPEHIYQIKELNVHTDDVQITGVKVVGEDDVTALFGEEGYLIEVSGNPFVNGKENQIANYLGNRMVGIAFRPFSAQILSNPLYEPFDVVRVSDRKGNVYLSILNSVSYEIGSYAHVACEAEDPVRNGSTYYSAAAAAVVEARRNSEKQITEYDKAVQNMNQLAMNALGFHTTYEDQPDGGRITYLHDKPLLEESQTIYKQTIDGFFISTDGGESYTAGFDKNGNVVVNVLYAIGIVADWIRSGRFEVKKRNKTTFLADADTGEVRIVADSFSLSSGETIDSIASDVVDNQTQEDIFNKLTNNNENSGIYLEGNNLYINARYIKTGEMSADRIYGGTLTLGGENNKNGKIVIKDEKNNVTGGWNSSGINISKGTLNGNILIYLADQYNRTSIFGFGGEAFGVSGGAEPVNCYIGMDAGNTKDTLYVNLDPEHKFAFRSDDVVKFLYTDKLYSNCVADSWNFFCNVDLHNYSIKNSYIDALKVKTSFNIPNNVDCNIYSHVDFHNYEIQNAKINNLIGVNGYTPYDGSIHFIAGIKNNENGGITWYPATATVKNGIITGVSENAK